MALAYPPINALVWLLQVLIVWAQMAKPIFVRRWCGHDGIDVKRSIGEAFGWVAASRGTLLSHWGVLPATCAGFSPD